MLESVVTSIIRHWLAVLLISVVTYLARNYFNHGLQRYPGPFIASLTDWWRFFDVLGRRPETTHINLHRQYGDIVRLGPNTLSFANPAALGDIYGLNKGFIKVAIPGQGSLGPAMLRYPQSNFYPVQQALARGSRLPSLFSTTDEQYHAQLRRSTNSAFSMSALVQYEPSVDSATAIFLDQTESLFSSRNAVCDFAQWLQWYAFDVVGEITYSKRHGFIEGAEDVDGMVSYLGWIFGYVAVVCVVAVSLCTSRHLCPTQVGQIPPLDILLLKNPVLRVLDWLGLNPFSFAVVRFARARIRERLSENNTGIPASRRGDLLDMFLKAKEERPDFFHEGRVLTMAVSMAFAGSDTTAISLAAVFYYLLRNPKCYGKLLDEIDDAARSGVIDNRPTGMISWTESQSLPYLDACIKEAFRLHPAVGLLLERVVPPNGATICGQHIAGGTIVGCNAWVIHRRPEVFGEDVDAYRPERWIEVSKEKRKEMESTMFHFGMGARTCIGKNISLLEVYKLVPSFLRRFEVGFNSLNEKV